MIIEKEKAEGEVTLVVIGLLLVILNPISGALAQEKFYPGNVWFWIQVVTAALIFAVGKVETSRARRLQETAETRELEARVETKIALADLLDPMATLLGQMGDADPADRRLLCSEAVQLILSSAANFLGPDRSRACWFVLEPGPPRRLAPTKSVGRTGSARTVFIEGTASGDAALAMVDHDETLICQDVLTDSPPGWNATRERDYRTFISVSVHANDTAYGMLTLDALEPGDLVEDDLLTLRLLAKLLAAALARG